MTWALHAAVIATALVLAACGPDAALDALPSGGRGRVVEAVAGDALSLSGGGTLRLAGIDAPKGDEAYAAEARAALARLALGRDVELLQGGARHDAYGRSLAQVRETHGRVWLQGALLRQGAARVRTYADNRALARPMLEAEAGARIARRGLWALPEFQVLLPEEVGPDRRGFTVVEGRVRRRALERGRAVLVMGDRPGGFAAEIPASARDDFSAGAMEPASLEGRLIRVRGAVRPTAAGPRLWLDHPEQVEVLADAATKNARR